MDKKYAKIIDTYEKESFRYIIYDSSNGLNYRIKEDGKYINIKPLKITNTAYCLKFKINYDKEYVLELNDGKKIVDTTNIKALNITQKPKNAFLKNFIIDELDISGVIHPLINIKGKTLFDNISLIIKGAKKDIIVANIDKMFDIKRELSINSKKIKILLNIRGVDIEILKIKTSISKRFLKKIFRILQHSIRKVILFSNIIVKGIRFLWREYRFLVPISMWKRYFVLFLERLKNPYSKLLNPLDIEEYNIWLKENSEESQYLTFDYNPKISVVMPVYNVRKEYLKDCLESILNQTYQNLEICIADDHSTNRDTLDILKEYEKKDSRIRIIYRKENGNISAASNTALQLVKGEFIAMVDNDDVLDKNAFYEAVKVLNINKKIDFIYTDEDKLNLDGIRCEPHFKPDYSPDTLLSTNYLCHLTILRTSIIKKIGGWRIGYEGAQDYDLFLRFVEHTTRDKIYHIPKILYHWRMVQGSTSLSINSKSYAIEKGKKALEAALVRRNISGIVHIHKKVPYYWIEYTIKRKPLISIIIPTRDFSDTLKVCIDSIYKKTTYKNYEIIIINNNSIEEKTYKLFEDYKKKHDNLEVMDITEEFNYSRINNVAIDVSKGEYVVLLNNDTEVITPNWLEIMLGYAMQKHIGAVGTKLLYPNKQVQHCGVILGIGGVAAHAGLDAFYDDPGMYGRYAVPYNYSAVTAACLMISKKKYQEVGGLEEKLKVAFNDIDFNIKLLKKGYYNICLPMVELYHYESKSRGLDTTSEKYKRFLSETDYMTKNWYKELNNDIFYNKNFSNIRGFKLEKNSIK